MTLFEEYGHCHACGRKVIRYPRLQNEEKFHHLYRDNGYCPKLKKCCVPPHRVAIIEDEDLPLEQLDG